MTAQWKMFPHEFGLLSRPSAVQQLAGRWKVSLEDSGRNKAVGRQRLFFPFRNEKGYICCLKNAHNTWNSLRSYFLGFDRQHTLFRCSCLAVRFHSIITFSLFVKFQNGIHQQYRQQTYASAFPAGADLFDHSRHMGV
jgi:hypothetical protein